MEKKSINFGFRGWMLVVYQFLAYVAFVAYTNWPMNVLADLYGGSERLSTLYTAAIVLGIIIQLILSRNIGKVKNIKVVSIALGVITMVFALGVMLIPASMQTLFQVNYFLVSVCSIVWCTFIIGILIGQWFPRRKGTVMGVVTIAFPFSNAILGPFAGHVFRNMATTHIPDVTGSYIPVFIACCIGIVIGAIFVKDYPEQCGGCRDNDHTITPEEAIAMMEQEIENKKTTVWTLGHTLKNGDFWLITFPMGFLLLASVGMMTQTAAIIGSFGYTVQSDEFGLIMLCSAIVTALGSWLLGVLDTKIGTKKAMIIATVFMIIAGIFGSMGSFTTLLVALGFLSVFLGAASNFTVSGAVQYWRREDFPSVFARVNPIANFLQALGPMIMAILLFSKGAPDATRPFMFAGICGVVSLILLLLFRPGRIKAADDKYREAAGKPLDDVLVGRV